MAGINKVIILGRLGSDPEYRELTSTSVCSMSVATSESWSDHDGNKKERTEWHRGVVFGRLGGLCAEHLAKGRQVYVEGKLQTRSWEDQEGAKRYTTEVVAHVVQFIDSKSSGESQGQFDFDPDEIPF